MLRADDFNLKSIYNVLNIDTRSSDEIKKYSLMHGVPVKFDDHTKNFRLKVFFFF